MSTDNGTLDTERSREGKLKSLVRRDIDPEITALAERALRHRQEGSS